MAETDQKEISKKLVGQMVGLAVEENKGGRGLGSRREGARVSYGFSKGGPRI